jgi:hypothetical protein
MPYQLISPVGCQAVSFVQELKDVKSLFDNDDDVVMSKEGGDRVIDVIERIKMDADFAKELGVAVRLVSLSSFKYFPYFFKMVSRLATLRSPVKMSAGTEIAGFMLGKGSRCVERVKALKEKDLYIFPGDWAAGNVLFLIL